LLSNKKQPLPSWAAGDPLLSLAQLGEYASLSVRQLRTFILHPILPLPHYRPGVLERKPTRRETKILVRKSEFDKWLELWRVRLEAPPRDVGKILDQAVREVRP
jgi:hypothetical protein